MKKCAVVTGAGSGVGRATAVALAQAGWDVALLGRRRDALAETARKTGAESRCLVWPCDIGKGAEVRSAAKAILDRFGAVDALINAAGTNVPARSLEVLPDEDYHSMIDANMNGAYYCVQAFLPGMRQRKSGSIVNIVSEAGKLASPKAGPGYVMSKFGMAGLNQSINAEERSNGIRACAIFPGDIDTPLLDKRPVPPDAQARQRMLQPEDVAACVLLALNLPDRAVIEEMIVRPR